MAKKNLTADRLRELVHYDPTTGLFTWTKNRAYKALGGTPAGYLNTNGYARITIDGISHAAHRLAWLYVHGRWPEATIDHINRIPHDNRLANLREASQSENNANSSRAIAWRWGKQISAATGVAL
jgi:hypothetical protein